MLVKIELKKKEAKFNWRNEKKKKKKKNIIFHNIKNPNFVIKIYLINYPSVLWIKYSEIF